ncbi:type IV secretion system protein [Ensifer aridi]|uniref:type IV secretion system protein n=1 Tax=Ensifer aridi TaxID=1708715 RepID=UPI000A114F97|nr:type IV secretion system protein [Ensifer aridi]
MGVISKLAHTIDATLVDYVQTVFEAAADPIRTLLGAIALIALLLLALNHITQFKAVNYSMYLHWGLRYILIYSFATIWVNFQNIYTMLVEVPDDYAALMMRGVAAAVKTNNPSVLDPARIKDTYSAMDEFAHAIVRIAYDNLSDLSVFKLAKAIRNIFMGMCILAIGGFFIAASAIIVLLGKIGLAVSISLAPLAIIMLMMPQTRQHFESWTRFTTGFALIPLLTAALMTVVLNVAGEILAAPYATVSFVFIMIAATVLLFMIPNMASTLASASVATVGAGAAVAAASMAKGAAMKLYTGGQRLRDGANVASTARAAGASPARSAWSAINAMRQSAHIRQQRRDERLARRIVQPSPKLDGRE